MRLRIYSQAGYGVDVDSQYQPIAKVLKEFQTIDDKTAWAGFDS